MTDIDHAAIGRVYADNLLGEPAVSRCLHAADEIEWRLRNGGVCPHVRGTVTQHCSLNFTLTAEEREAIEAAAWACGRCGGFNGDPSKPALYKGNQIEATLRNLLSRL
jgi:hypothetical protein